jgi:(p)ppGpp synthase/HD superfamily hydrolase
VEGEDRQIAAVLHDTVEDCGIELSQLRLGFGAHIAEAVDALTRRDGEAYSDFIERCAANDLARSVKEADLRDNMDASRIKVMTERDHARMTKYRETA